MFRAPRMQRRLAGWLSTAILLTQLVTAAYACPLPAQAGAVGDAAAGLPCADMAATEPGADAPASADVDHPSGAAPSALCVHHCQAGSTQQPADPLATVALPAVVQAWPWRLQPAGSSAVETPALARDARRRDRAPPPWLGDLHCCYRL